MLGIDRRERKEVDVVDIGLHLVLAGEEGTDEVHANLLGTKGSCAFFPLATVGAGLLKGDQFLPGLEHVHDPLIGPLFLAGHERDVEVVPVGAHVQLVEHAHLRPATIVGGSQRGDLVGLHLFEQCHPLIPGHRYFVALVGEDALLVVHAPGVVVERHEVLLAVSGGRRLLERVAQTVGLAPHIADITDKALGRNGLHAVAGEP